MTCVALLRGINVGGKRKVDMKQLKTSFQRIGMKNVQTYINSGNVIFETDMSNPFKVSSLLEAAIEEDFGFPVRVLLRDRENIRALVNEVPDNWIDGPEAKCDILFLFDEIDSPEVLRQITIKNGIDDVRYLPGALLWRVCRSNVSRSGMMKLPGTDLYALMTVRNCNTLRKLDTLMQNN